MLLMTDHMERIGVFDLQPVLSVGDLHMIRVSSSEGVAQASTRGSLTSTLKDD